MLGGGVGWLIKHDHRFPWPFWWKYRLGTHAIAIPFWTAGNFSPIEGSLKKTGDPTSVQCPMYENAMETQQILSKIKLQNLEV